jgi:hypothetical protein
MMNETGLNDLARRLQLVELEVVGPTNCESGWSGLEPRRGSARTTSLTLLWFGSPLLILYTRFRFGRFFSTATSTIEQPLSVSN